MKQIVSPRIGDINSLFVRQNLTVKALSALTALKLNKPSPTQRSPIRPHNLCLINHAVTALDRRSYIPMLHAGVVKEIADDHARGIDAVSVRGRSAGEIE